MPTGKDWNLTDKRKEDAIRLLQDQYSITLIARIWGIDDYMLGQKLKKAGINYKEIQNDGIRLLKANMFAEVNKIDEADKKVKLSLDILKQYDKSDDVANHTVPITFGKID
jgi:hypothetical protein